MKRWEWKGPLVAVEVLPATDPALGALRCLWTARALLPALSGTQQSIAQKCLASPGLAPHSVDQSGSACGGTSLLSHSMSLWGLRLPGVLELLPQPGGQCLAHLV